MNWKVSGIISIIISSILLSATSVFACDETEYYNNSYALVIGIDQYGTETWKRKNLRYAVKDGEAIAAFLESQCFKVKRLFNGAARRLAIMSYLNSLARQVGRNDRIVVFFAGHGYTEVLAGQDYGYIVPVDGDDTASYISMEELRTVSRKMGAAKHQLFIMDSCFGGLLGTRPSGVPSNIPNYLKDITDRSARQILTAGGRNQQVVEPRDGGQQHSFFTYHLLEALQNGRADLNQDGYITFPELTAYLVPSASNDYQTPAAGTFPEHSLGEFVFRSGHRPLSNSSAKKPQQQIIPRGLNSKDAEIPPRNTRRDTSSRVLLRDPTTGAILRDAATGAFLTAETEPRLSKDETTHSLPQEASPSSTTMGETLTAKCAVKGDWSNEPSEKIFEKAQAAYVSGDRVCAIGLSLLITQRGNQDETLRAWRFIGGAACSIHSTSLATLAYSSLVSAEHRQMIVELCKRNGLELRDGIFSVD